MQQPYPPILVAGAGPNILNRVVGQGDGWMPFVVSNWVEAMANRIVPDQRCRFSDVHRHDHQALVFIFPVESFESTPLPLTVGSPGGPEVQQDNLSQE